MTIRAVLMRLSDAGERNSNETVRAIKENLENFKVCWVPWASGAAQAPGLARMNDINYLVIARGGYVLHVLEIDDFRKQATPIPVDSLDARYPSCPTFDTDIFAWFTVGLLNEELSATQVEHLTSIPRGVKYLEHEKGDSSWKLSSQQSPQCPSRSTQPDNCFAPTKNPKLTALDLSKVENTQYLGIDLTASESKASAAVILKVQGGVATWSVPEKPLKTNSQILEFVSDPKWSGIALDGPQGYPSGWVDFAEKGEEPTGPRSRKCERDVHRTISSIFFTSPRARLGVKEWIKRSVSIFKDAHASPSNSPLIEVYPHASFVALCNGSDTRSLNPLFPKSQKRGRVQRQELLHQLLGSFPLEELAQGNAEEHDILDAGIAAVTALCAKLGLSRALGDANDGGLIHVPQLPAQ